MLEIVSVFIFILFLYFLASTLYVVVLSIGGALKNKKTQNINLKKPFYKICILVPAYKEDTVILHSAEYLSQLHYPSELFQVYIIADSLKEETLTKLKKLPVKLLEVSFEKSTKAKALNQAFSSIKDEFDIAIISDADNILENDFLNKINTAFLEGKTVVQGRRVAKNLNSPFAVLDAYSEVVNNYIFRKGTNALGLSSALIGSGMAFQFNEIKEIMRNIDAVGGFDRKLQLVLIERGHMISYLEDAVIYDEKIADSNSFEKQRRRWNSSQYKYLQEYFLKGLKMLAKGDFSYFNLAILNNIFLSRIINLGCIFFITSIITITKLAPFNHIMAWWILVVLYLMALLIPLHSIKYKKELFQNLLFIPKVFLLSVKTALSMKGADQTFIHTAHHYTESNHINEERK